MVPKPGTELRRLSVLDSWSNDRKVVLAICAMEKKSKSGPMNEILGRLPSSEFEVLYFSEEMILSEPSDNWPVCDALISFYSSNFPLEKVEEYIQRVHPFCLNDLESDRLLLDRRRVYETLSGLGIKVPRHVVVDRDEGTETISFLESEDFIEVDGLRLQKPFVEKPVSGEDHNIYIYYPMAAGGGCKKLFRKVGNKSSQFYPEHNRVRRDGSYIYEEFLPTQGVDVKVYCVGPDYYHAEARKAPTLDGVVLRDTAGKEIRYPVILTPEEKEMARKVCLSFGPTVCGMDILRVGSESYCCDVNGWSFVKNSKKYYEDCATLLRTFMLKNIKGEFLHFPSSLESPAGTSVPDLSTADLSVGMPLSPGTTEELRGVFAIIRHGDRTPKQKLKMKVSHQLFLDYYHKHCKRPGEDLKLKSRADLEELLNVALNLLEMHHREDPEFEEYLDTKYGTSDEVKSEVIAKIETLRDVLQRSEISGFNRKVQLKPRRTPEGEANGSSKIQEILLIMKWGGELTDVGKEQALQLGKKFRLDMYPSAGLDGGVLRLHSTYRHDLKIYSSDEGRVQMSAAAFAKGFLELEGDLIPILVSLVTKTEQAEEMLDASTTGVHDNILEVKRRLHNILHTDRPFDEHMREHVNPAHGPSIDSALNRIGNPKEKLKRIHELLGGIVDRVRRLIETHEDLEPFGKETKAMMLARVSKLYHDFYNPKTDTYDLAKIPDVHDTARYDAIHNSHLRLPGLYELFDCSSALAEVFVPQEYGMSIEEKRRIGRVMCKSLLKKIVDDVDIAKDGALYKLHPDFATELGVKSYRRFVRTRLYFTSESHLYSMINALRYPSGGVASPLSAEGARFIDLTPELCYLTHIVIRIFERKQFSRDDPRHFRAEILFSPGADVNPVSSGDPYPLTVREAVVVSDPNLTSKHLQSVLAQAIAPEAAVDGRLDRMSIAQGGNAEEEESDRSSNVSDDEKPKEEQDEAEPPPPERRRLRSLRRRESSVDQTPGVEEPVSLRKAFLPLLFSTTLGLGVIYAVGRHFSRRS